MTKTARNNGITIRMGAAHDDVTVRSNGKSVVYDKAQMRRDNDKKRGEQLVDRLNKEIVNAYCDEHGLNKDRRAARRERKQKDKERRGR